jgi:hypothetical protein
MSHQFVATADELIEQLVIQCWLFEAREGNADAARAKAGQALERLLRAGLPHITTATGDRFDPYSAANLIKARKGELPDESWAAWQATTRRNALSLPGGRQIYEFSIRREWHGYSAPAGRNMVLRLPLPLRGSQLGPAQIRLVNPVASGAEIRESPGRVEIRIEPATLDGPVVAELTVQFVGEELADPGMPAAAMGEPVSTDAQIWLRDKEGLVVQSDAVATLAGQLARGCTDARQFVHAAWRWLMRELRFGDWHRSDMDPSDPLGRLLGTRRADCMLGSSLLIALCRARGIPARLLSGFLLHPANIGPHSWAEVLLAPGQWVPFDFGSWCYCAGDPDDPAWGNFYRGRVDARFVAEVAPREFTGWGNAQPPEQWYRLESLDAGRIVHTLHALPQNRLFRRDVLDLRIVGPATAPP